MTNKFLLLAILVCALQNPVPCSGESIKKNQTKSQNSGQQVATEQRGTEQSPAVVKILPTPISKEEAESFYILCKDIFSRFGVGDSKAQYDIDGTKVQKKQSLDHSKMIVAGLKASNFTSLPTFLQPIKAYTK